MKRMLATVNHWLQSLSPRDRRALWLGSGSIIALLLIGSLLTLQERRDAASLRLEQKRALLATLPASLDRLRRIERLGADATLPLGTLVRRLLQLSGLDAAVEILTDGSVVVVLTDASFDGTLELIAEFEAHRIAVRQARIDAGVQSGTVNARFDLGPRSASAP